MKHPAALSCEHGINSLRSRFPTVRCLWNHHRRKLAHTYWWKPENCWVFIVWQHIDLRDTERPTLFFPASLNSQRLSFPHLFVYLALPRHIALSFCHCGVCYLLHSCRELLNRLAWKILSVEPPHIVCSSHLPPLTSWLMCLLWVCVCCTSLF